MLANDTDIEGDPITITSASEPANGTVVLTGGSPGARTGLTYQPDLNYCNTQPAGTPDTFTYTINGGDDATVSVTVTCVDDPPVAVNDTATVLEDAAATAITVLNNDTDVDGGPKAINAITQPTNGTVVTTGGGTGLTYEPDPNYCNTQPGGTPDTFTYTLTPGASTATVCVTVTCVDDPPVAVNDTATVLEDAAATAITVLANDTDIDAGPTTITTVTQPGNGTVAITGGGTGLTYQPATPTTATTRPAPPPTRSPTPSTAGRTATVAVTVTCVNDPPVAGDDSFTGVNAALANTRLVVGTTSTGPHLTVAGSVLTNDTDIDSPAIGFTAGPATISSANCAGCNNVTMEADGNFIYDPPAGFTGNDTFTYTVNDNDPDTPANQTDTATVTIQVVGPLVWYVDIDAAAPPAGQGGRSHSPFNTLAPLTTGGTADTLDGTGDIIFVGVDNAPATGPYEGGIVLETNQKLWGEPFGLNVDPPGARPSTQLVAATRQHRLPTTRTCATPPRWGRITLANGVDIQRVNAGVTGTASTTGISGTATTTATIGPNQLIHGNTTGIVLTGAAGGDITVAAAIIGTTGNVVNVANRSSGTVTFSGDITSTDGNGGVFLNGNTGATIAFTGAINLTGTGPAGTTFTATGGGTITANNAANQITGFTGTTAGVNLNGVAIGTAGITFNTSPAPQPGRQRHPADQRRRDRRIHRQRWSDHRHHPSPRHRRQRGNVTIGATLTTSGAAARSVEVTNRDGGTVDINGLVTDTSQGINLTTNGTGLIRFDGGITPTTGPTLPSTPPAAATIAVTDPAARQRRTTR